MMLSIQSYLRYFIRLGGPGVPYGTPTAAMGMVHHGPVFSHVGDYTPRAPRPPSNVIAWLSAPA